MMTQTEHKNQEMLRSNAQQQRKCKKLTLYTASSKTSTGPVEPTMSSGCPEKRPKEQPAMQQPRIISDTPIHPLVFSPGHPRESTKYDFEVDHIQTGLAIGPGQLPPNFQKHVQ